MSTFWTTPLSTLELSALSFCIGLIVSVAFFWMIRR